MPTTTISAIYLGNFPDLDPIEAPLSGAESAGDLIGRTFGSAGNPLSHSIVQLSMNDTDGDGVISSDNYGVPPTESISIAGGNYYIDSGILYRGTVTYTDGTTATDVPLSIMQSIDGHLVLLPPNLASGPDEVTGLTSKQIQSIIPTSILQNSYDDLYPGQYPENGPTFICFRHGTLIRTDHGDIAVEDLKPGDMVLTRDRGYQPLRWLGSKHVTSELLRLFASIRPVRISAGALGPGLPERDLFISQQHRILVQSRIAERIFGSAEVLVAAKHLLLIDGVDIDNGEMPLTYYHLLFDQHEIVFSNGAETESLFTGAEALRAVEPAARAEIIALFPELVQSDRQPVSARPLGTGRAARKLAHRHLSKHRALQKPVA